MKGTKMKSYTEGTENQGGIAEEFMSGIENLREETLREILSFVICKIMKAERDVHLMNSEDKANGYYSRSLGTNSGLLDINVPRTRQEGFRPRILPEPYRRDYEDKLRLLHSLFLSSYSPNDMRRILGFLDLHYKPEDMDKIRKTYLDEFNKLMHRELPKDMVGVFIDAYHAELLSDGKVRKMDCYVVLGVDFSGKKDLLGLYVTLGGESREFWLQGLNDLIDRGLKRLIIAVSNDFPGLKSAVAALFPKALHQQHKLS